MFYYSILFDRIAGIECSSVSGISKAAGYYPGSIDTQNPNSDHAWNIVTIKGVKFFVEATWAAGLPSEGEINSFIHNNELNDEFNISSINAF